MSFFIRVRSFQPDGVQRVQLPGPEKGKYPSQEGGPQQLPVRRLHEVLPVQVPSREALPDPLGGKTLRVRHLRTEVHPEAPPQETPGWGENPFFDYFIILCFFVYIKTDVKYSR